MRGYIFNPISSTYRSFDCSTKLFSIINLRLIHQQLTSKSLMTCYPDSPFTRVNDLRVFLKHSLRKSWLQSDTEIDEDDCGEIKFRQLERWLTRPPKYTTIRFNSNQMDSSLAISKLTEILSARCHRFPVESLSISVHPILKDLLIVTNGGYQLDSLQPYGKPVIIDLRTGQSVLRGSEIYVGGIIGAPADLRKTDRVSIYVDIEGKCLKGWKQLYKGAKVFIGNGISFHNRRDIFSDHPPNGIGVQLTNCLNPAPSLYGNMDNLYFAQNFPSMVTVYTLDVEPGQTVLDMCSAPGGKTTHLASLMNQTGTLIACDVSKSRIEKLKSNLQRWQMDQFVSVFTHDCTKPIGTNNNQLTNQLEPPFQESTFDRILLDAPCSGLGQRPQLVGDKTLSSFLSFPKIQSRLIENAVKLLKPNGILVYSTCSFTIEENEQIVDQILTNYPQIKLKSQKPYHFGGTGLKGDHNLTEDDLTKIQRFLNINNEIDSPEVDTIGFTICKLQKIS